MIGAITGVLASRTDATPITLIPFTVDNAPAFINPNITTISFTVNTGPGFTNPTSTTIPFTVNNNPAPTTDPYWSSVTLLVDASNETNNTTPSTIDVTGKAPTYHGTTMCKTNQFRFGSSSMYFDGVTTARCTFADSAAWAMGTGDATWEAWVRPEGNTGTIRIWISNAASFGGFFSVQGSSSASNNFYRAVSNGTTTYQGTGLTISNDAWHHLAIVRQGANLYGYIDGVGELSSSSLSGVTLLDSTGAMSIGSYADADSALTWKGWIDQVRITKGVARYPNGTSFGIPNGPFPHS